MARTLGKTMAIDGRERVNELRTNAVLMPEPPELGPDHGP